MPNQFQTREEWLNFVMEASRPKFAQIAPLPEKVRLSVGFTSNGYRGKAIGECWDSTASGDKHFEIFVKPDQDQVMRVADILVHELCHAAVGTEHGHKRPFKRVAQFMGLEGKMTATTGGDEFKAWMSPILKKAGPLPHKSLRAFRLKKKQTTRLLKCECCICGYTARTTMKWLEEAGAPVCPKDAIPLGCDAIDDEGED